jgi:hypothetical protein
MSQLARPVHASSLACRRARIVTYVKLLSPVSGTMSPGWLVSDHYLGR